MFRRLASPQGWIHAAIGAAVWWPAGGFGLVAACLAGRASSSAPYAWAVATLLVLVAVGLSATTRRVSVALANGLLGTDVPAATRRGGWSARFRSAGWLLVQAFGGGLLAAVTLYAALSAAIIPLVWLGASSRDRTFEYLGLQVTVPSGIAGIWTVPVSLAHVAVALAAGAGYVALLRRLAPPLLGPGTAERMAALAEHTDRLAHRNRLARELHDSIGHTLTASTIQAAVASTLMDSDPAAARRAMDSIEEASRTALEDLDHVLGVLRDGASSRVPQHTLADVPALVERVRHAGTAVDLDVTGDTAGVPATVSREAYRIVQEGLTNAMRQPGPVAVRIAAGPDRLDVELTNPVAAGAADGDRRGGHGLSGIAERVHVLRGEVTAGPVDDPAGRRWVLAAWLPTGTREAGQATHDPGGRAGHRRGADGR